MDHMDWVRILQYYLAIINMAGFAIMAIDKGKARRGAWRIPEKTLLTIAAAGGAPGIWLGMYMFRHKTKKLKFSLGVPGILALQVLAVVLLLNRFQV
jgi:uncharacterized membrane protein YsdA (DUF1294 family)